MTLPTSCSRRRRRSTPNGAVGDRSRRPAARASRSRPRVRRAGDHAARRAERRDGHAVAAGRPVARAPRGDRAAGRHDALTRRRRRAGGLHAGAVRRRGLPGGLAGRHGQLRHAAARRRSAARSSSATASGSTSWSTGSGVQVKLAGRRPARPGHRPDHDGVRQPAAGPVHDLRADLPGRRRTPCWPTRRRAGRSTLSALLTPWSGTAPKTATASFTIDADGRRRLLGVRARPR